jgi:protein involved in polysaccharide export with SLBB domain
MKRRFPILALVLVGLLSLAATAQTQETPRTVTVVGAVNKPGIYQMPTTGLTLLQALAISGGLQPTANSREAKVVRQAPGAALTISLDLRSILSGKQKDVLLQPDDVISIPFSMPTSTPRLADPPVTPPLKDIAKVAVTQG